MGGSRGYWLGGHCHQADRRLELTFHTRETFGSVYHEGIGIDGFTVVHLVSDSLEETQLEAVPE